MRYPKEFYEELKASWESAREELQQKRKEIDDKRNEFYRKYYAVKNGIKLATDAGDVTTRSPDSVNLDDDSVAADNLFNEEGTRPKQNRERKFERDKIDARTNSAREEFDNSQETWSQHYEAVAQGRATADSERLERLNVMFADLERAWEEYRELVNKYHSDYYAVEPLRRQSADQQVYAASVKEKEDYQTEFETQVEQDRLFAAEAWEAMAKLHAEADAGIKQQREVGDKELTEQRKKQKEDNQEYNINYYSRIKTERNHSDLERVEKRKDARENLKTFRKESDDYYNNNNSWYKYREDSLKYRAEEKIEDSNFFYDWFASVNKRLSAYLPWVSHSLRSTMSLIVNSNADQFRSVSMSENIKSIRSWVYGAITGYSSVSDGYLSAWFKSIPDMYVKAKESHNDDLSRMNEDYTSLSNETSTIADAVAIISKEHASSRSRLLQLRNDADRASNETRSKLFMNYDEYIKNFFKTRRESRNRQLLQRSLTRSEADIERTIMRQKHLYDTESYAVEVERERSELFEKYTNDIRTLREHGLTGHARNKAIAMTIRTGWFKVIDGLFNSGRFIANGIIKTGYVLQDVAIYILRAGITFGSFAYYAIGSGAYLVHIIDRYLIRNAGFLSYDFMKALARATGDFFDYSLFGLIVAARALGLALYKIPLFYALRRTANALWFAIRVVTLPVFYMVARVVNFAFKFVYFPVLVLLGMMGEISLRIINSTLALLIGLKLVAEAFGMTVFGIGSTVLFPIYAIADFGSLAIARTLNLAYRFTSHLIMDSAYLVYVIGHNIITPVSRLMYDGGELIINATGAMLRYIWRKMEDIGHDLYKNLYQNMLMPVFQSMRDFSVWGGRKTSDVLTTICRNIGSFMFSSYVGAYTLKTRVSYALGFSVSDVTYYGGRLVTHASRFAYDRYHGAGSTLSHLIPVAAGVQKGATKAARVVESAAIATARAADDYIGYPVTYAYKNVSVGVGRRLWDGSVNVWRGVQDMCTYSIRGFHDVGHEIDKRVSPPLVSFGRVVEDQATNAGQSVKYGAYKAHDALQTLNIAYILEHNADQVLRDLAINAQQGQPDNTTPSL